MTITDSDRIAAPGVPITVAGEQQHLRYSFRSLKKLEDHFGSLADAAVAINRVFSDGMSTSIVGDLGVLVAAGIDGAEPDTILDQLDGDDRSQTIIDAAVCCSNAWAQAFPPLETVPGKAEGEADGTASPGASSTTSPPSPAAATTPPSGP